MIIFIYKSCRKLILSIKGLIDKVICIVIFKGNKVRFSSFRSSSYPYVVVCLGGKLTIGNNFSMHNGIRGNPIGCYSRCTFYVDKGAEIHIGDNVGVSQTAIICYKSIIIGDNVKLGGGVKIYDTDFHSLDPLIRSSKEDFKYKKKAEVHIKKNAFIGAYCIILKGVTVGENSIIGAGSVVTKSVPDNQIWGGNPAKFIKNI